jgi:hypothetical protein
MGITQYLVSLTQIVPGDVDGIQLALDSYKRRVCVKDITIPVISIILTHSMEQSPS